MNKAAMFSSNTDNWSTPQYLFDRLSRIYRFTLDVCALPENAKCDRYYTPEMDGLSKKWEGGVWCNPPYGKGIGNWTRKAAEEIQKDYCDFIVMLLPARTDTRWFWRDVKPVAEIQFIEGRIKFNGSGENAPFPSMLAIYMKNPNRRDNGDCPLFA